MKFYWRLGGVTLFSHRLDASVVGEHSHRAATCNMAPSPPAPIIIVASIQSGACSPAGALCSTFKNDSDASLAGFCSELDARNPDDRVPNLRWTRPGTWYCCCHRCR